jgi:hypothetical protein
VGASHHHQAGTDPDPEQRETKPDVILSEAKGLQLPCSAWTAGAPCPASVDGNQQGAPRILNFIDGMRPRGEHPEHSALAGGTRSSVYRRSARIPPAPPSQSWSVEIEAAEPLSAASVPFSAGQTKLNPFHGPDGEQRVIPLSFHCRDRRRSRSARLS